MKVLQINCVYRTGSTGKIVYDIHTELQKQGIESVVCYGRGEKINEPNVYKTCGELYSKINNLLSRFTGIMYGGGFFSTRKLIHIIEKEKPDVVHLHCLNGYFVNIYRLIIWLKKHHIHTVLTLHAEFMYTANCGNALDCEKWMTGCGNCPRLKKETQSLIFDQTHTSWMKMKKAFDGFNDNLIVTSVSPWLMKRAKQSPILSDKNHYVILNGIDTENVFHPRTSKLRKELGLENKKVVVHVTASFTREIKGGKYVIELAKRMPDVVFIVIGNTDKGLSLPNNIIDIGRTENQTELAEYYSIADAFLLTSQKETFCMPVAESLCCGTPVVGFKAGAPEEIAIPEFSAFVDFGDTVGLQAGLEKVLKKTANHEDISEKAIAKYSKHIMAEGYLSVYGDVYIPESKSKRLK